MQKIKDKEKVLRLYRARSIKAQMRRHKLSRKLKGFRRSLERRSKSEVSAQTQRRREITAVAPSRFALLKDANGCVSFINRLDALLSRRKPVFVDMRQVTEIDYGALSTLLAVMFKFKEQGIQFNGNFPQDAIASSIVQQSGFLYRLFDNSSAKTIYQINEKNQFVTQNNDGKFDQALISSRIVPDATTTIWGSNKRCPGIYPIVLELIDNTRAHASKRGEGIERWWLSINHDEVNKKVSFVFLDYGIGIFSSLTNKPDDDPRKKTFAKLQQRLGISANEKHLQALVAKGGQTSTGLKNRGLGIHGIRLANDRNQISNLYIISNFAFGDISNSRYEKINENFNGTLFYWELCYSNEHLG